MPWPHNELQIDMALKVFCTYLKFLFQCLGFGNSFLKDHFVGTPSLKNNSQNSLSFQCPLECFRVVICNMHPE